MTKATKSLLDLVASIGSQSVSERVAGVSVCDGIWSLRVQPNLNFTIMPTLNRWWRYLHTVYILKVGLSEWASW